MLKNKKTIKLPSILSFNSNNDKVEYVGDNTNLFTTNIKELNDIYDIEVNNIGKAREILNDNLVAEINTLVKNSKIKFRVHIIQDVLYIWFDFDNNLFKPSIIHKITFKRVKKMYDSFNEIKNISEKLYELFAKN